MFFLRKKQYNHLHNPKKSLFVDGWITREVAKLWDEQCRSWWGPTCGSESLHMTDQQNLVTIGYVQAILLKRMNSKCQ